MIIEPLTKDVLLGQTPTETETCQALLGQLSEQLGLPLRLATVPGLPGHPEHFQVERPFEGRWVRLCTPALPIPAMKWWLLGATTALQFFASSGVTTPEGAESIPAFTLPS